MDQECWLIRVMADRVIFGKEISDDLYEKNYLGGCGM